MLELANKAEGLGESLQGSARVKPDNLNSVYETHMVERELWQTVPGLCMREPVHMHVCAHTHLYTQAESLLPPYAHRRGNKVS